MSWQPIFPIYTTSEADIQAYFEKWNTMVPQWRQAGAPGWLAEMVPVPSRDLIRTGPGYGFFPDLLASSRGEELVLELKCACKYEPLALGEVLHHAWMLSNTADVGGAAPSGARRTPVMVTQYSNWLRAAFAFLVEHGLSRSVVKHIEFTALKVGSDTLLWFDEPHANWTRCKAPSLPEGLSVDGADWYRVEDTATWIAVKKQKKLAHRPPLWTDQYLMLTLVPHGEEILTWDGSPGEAGRYLLWRPRGRRSKPIKIQMA